MYSWHMFIVCRILRSAETMTLSNKYVDDGDGMGSAGIGWMGMDWGWAAGRCLVVF